jgi:hypothetical protein
MQNGGCSEVLCFTITDPTIQGCNPQMYLYVPGFWKVTVNGVEVPRNVCSCPLGSSQPELTYFSVLVIVYEGLGGANSFTLPCESITDRKTYRLCYACILSKNMIITII